MNIRSIKAEQTYALRQEILRPGLPLDACKFPEDHDQFTVHFGAYETEKSVSKVLGIVSLFNVDEPGTSDEYHGSAWQIRAMATDEIIRGKGYAAALLVSCEKYALSRGGSLIWCNARTSAVGFYMKQGYQVAGEEFEIVGVGPHFRMKKYLK